MIFAWTPELLTAAMTGLNPKERAALDLLQSTATAANPGPVRLRRFGFERRHDYEAALESAKMRVKRYFEVRGIRRVSDLDFMEPGRSVEARIQQRAVSGARKESSGSAGAETSGDS